MDGPLKNGILTESQSNMGQECGVTTNCTILKMILAFNLLPWSVSWRVMAIMHREEWRNWRCTSRRRHVTGFQKLQSAVKLQRERTNWLVVYRPDLGTQEVREKRRLSGHCSQCLELLAHGNATYACVLARLCLTMDYSLQASVFMGFSRHEYWSRLPCFPPGDLPYPGTYPPSGDLPIPGIKPASSVSPALVGRFVTTEPPSKHNETYACV